MEFPVQNAAGRWGVVALSCVVSAILIFQALEIWIADRRIGTGRLETMERGAELLPGNGEAWDRIGRFWQLDFVNPDSHAAVRNYLKAVGDDPRSSYYWMDLASAYEDVGELPQARAAYERAEAVYPLSALVAWNYGNFLVRTRDYRAGYGKIRRAVVSDPKLLPLAISRTWRSSENVNFLLDDVLPSNSAAYLQALDYLASINSPDACLAVWQRLIALGKPLAISDAFPFMDKLIEDDRPADARRVWREALAAAGIAERQTAGGSLITDGTFAHDFANGGLDWRWTAVTGVSASFDSPPPSGIGRSIRLDFEGGTNIALYAPAQFVPVDPGATYHFRGYMRTEDITTESGPQFSIVDANHSNAVNFETNSLTGTHPWQVVEGDVTAGPETRFFLVRLQRKPSRLFENKLSGTVWIGEVSLTTQGERERASP